MGGVRGGLSTDAFRQIRGFIRLVESRSTRELSQRLVIAIILFNNTL